VYTAPVFHTLKTKIMTTKMTKQFLDLAKRYALHGQKNNFYSGMNHIEIDGTKFNVKVYFTNYSLEKWCIYFQSDFGYQKKVEVQGFSSSMTFCYLMKESEFNKMIDVFTKHIEELESSKIIIDENNKRIQSKINQLEEQISELSKNLKS
jgi:hypothetical protein